MRSDFQQHLNTTCNACVAVAESVVRDGTSSKLFARGLLAAVARVGLGQLGSGAVAQRAPLLGEGEIEGDVVVGLIVVRVGAGAVEVLLGGLLLAVPVLDDPRRGVSERKGGIRWLTPLGRQE